MGKHFFDYEDGDFAHTLSDNMAIDSDGNMLMRMGDNMAMDMETGNLRMMSCFTWHRDYRGRDFLTVMESLSEFHSPFVIYFICSP